MHLEPRNLAHYLLARGQLEPGAVMRGDFMVAEAGRRNRNFKILRREGPGLFVKQVGSHEPGARETLAREAAVYRMLAGDARWAPLSELCTRLVDWDPASVALTVELVPGESVPELRQRGAGNSPLVAATIGETLARWHAGSRELLRAGALPSPDPFPRRPPWVLSLADWDPTHASLRPAHRELVLGLQARPELAGALARLRAGWHHEVLIHGDVKWDNIMVSEAESPTPKVRLIDWELADLGDPAWDLAGLLQSYLCAWLASLPIDLASAPQSWLRDDRELDSMLPAIAALIDAYLVAAPRAGIETRDGFLLRCMHMTAARLLQSIYELEFASPAGLSPRGQVMLRLASASMRDGVGALRELLGVQP